MNDKMDFLMTFSRALKSPSFVQNNMQLILNSSFSLLSANKTNEKSYLKKKKNAQIFVCLLV